MITLTGFAEGFEIVGMKKTCGLRRRAPRSRDQARRFSDASGETGWRSFAAPI
jgi:hypothetical protein